MENDTKNEIVYELLSDIHSIEWQRTVSTENKAICIIGFVGVLSVYGANLAFSCLANISNNKLLVGIGVLCILALAFTFLTSFRALFYGNPSILSEKYIMEEYTNKNVVILSMICIKLDTVIRESNHFNNNRNRLLKMSVGAFLISIVLLSIFTFYCACSQPSSLNSNCNNYSNTSVNTCIQPNHSKNKYVSNSPISYPNNNKSFIYISRYKQFNFTPHKRY